MQVVAKAAMTFDLVFVTLLSNAATTATIARTTPMTPSTMRIFHLLSEMRLLSVEGPNDDQDYHLEGENRDQLWDNARRVFVVLCEPVHQVEKCISGKNVEICVDRAGRVLAWQAGTHELPYGPESLPDVLVITLHVASSMGQCGDGWDGRAGGAVTRRRWRNRHCRERWSGRRRNGRDRRGRRDCRDSDIIIPSQNSAQNCYDDEEEDQADPHPPSPSEKSPEPVVLLFLLLLFDLSLLHRAVVHLERNVHDRSEDDEDDYDCEYQKL